MWVCVGVCGDPDDLCILSASVCRCCRGVVVTSDAGTQHRLRWDEDTWHVGCHDLMETMAEQQLQGARERINGRGDGTPFLILSAPLEL